MRLYLFSSSKAFFALRNDVWASSALMVTCDKPILTRTELCWLVGGITGDIYVGKSEDLWSIRDRCVYNLEVSWCFALAVTTGINTCNNAIASVTLALTTAHITVWVDASTLYTKWCLTIHIVTTLASYTLFLVKSHASFRQDAFLAFVHRIYQGIPCDTTSAYAIRGAFVAGAF